MTKQSHDPSQLVQMVTKTATAVRRRFRACGFTVDLDDVAQDAALSVLETASRGNVREDANPSGYYYRAAAIYAGNAASRSLAAPTLSRRLSSRGREYQVRVGIVGCGEQRRPESGAVELVDLTTPDARSERVRRARDRLRAQVRLRRELERVLGSFDGPDRAALVMLLGWDGAVTGGVEEVAWRLRRHQVGVTRAVERLRVALVADSRAREARALIRRSEEP